MRRELVKGVMERKKSGGSGQEGEKRKQGGSR